MLLELHECLFGVVINYIVVCTRPTRKSMMHLLKAQLSADTDVTDAMVASY